MNDPFPIFSVYQAPFLLKFCRCPITNIYFRSFLHALCYPFSGIMMNIKMNMALAQAAFCMKICEKSLLSISHQYYIPFQAKSINPYYEPQPHAIALLSHSYPIQFCVNSNSFTFLAPHCFYSLTRNSMGYVLR